MSSHVPDLCAFLHTLARSPLAAEHALEASLSPFGVVVRISDEEKAKHIARAAIRLIRDDPASQAALDHAGLTAARHLDRTAHLYTNRLPRLTLPPRDPADESADIDAEVRL